MWKSLSELGVKLFTKTALFKCKRTGECKYACNIVHACNVNAFIKKSCMGKYVKAHFGILVS